MDTTIALLVGFIAGALLVYVLTRRRNEKEIALPSGNGASFTNNLSPSIVQSSQAGSFVSLSELEPYVKTYIQNRQVIEAIKFVREKSGMGLKESKDYVEAIQAGKSVN